jgi:hypothetical protein
MAGRLTDMIQFFRNKALGRCPGTAMKPINTSTYTFWDLREGDSIYVDKTAILHPFVQQSKGGYLLSRPRRFGKSLTLSTFEEIRKQPSMIRFPSGNFLKPWNSTTSGLKPAYQKVKSEFDNLECYSERTI